MLRVRSLDLPSDRVAALDWMRGIVIVLMVLDHSSAVLNPGRVMADTVWHGGLGAALPIAQWLTRWITHLCAPTFIFLSGTSLALSSHRRRSFGASWQDIDRHVATRGLLLIGLELWMALAFGMVLFQVLYAIGAGMIGMVLLRRLPTRVLLVASVAWILGLEAVTLALGATFQAPPPAWMGAFIAPAICPNLVFGVGGGFLYPALAWLPVMALGWVYGTFLLARPARARRLLPALAAVALGAFLVQRVLDGYGNFGLVRTDGSVVRWLQVSKYPPSIAYLGLELGILFLVVAALFAIARRRSARSDGPLLVFGQTALFFYVVHAHVLRLVAVVVTGGGYGKPDWPLWASYVAAAMTLFVLYPLCRWFRGYKRRRPTSWARYF